MFNPDHGHRSAGRRPGLRERAKERKLARIVQAGRRLFVQKGFEATSTRAIAARAGVASGTFFLYFHEKRDLLFHLFLVDVSATLEQAFASLPRDGALVEQLTHVFGRLYRYYGKDPRLSRIFMKELLFLAPGEGQAVMASTYAFMGRISELVQQAVDRGEVDASCVPASVSAHVFALYLFFLTAMLNGAVAGAEDAETLLGTALAETMRGVGSRAPRGSRRDP